MSKLLATLLAAVFAAVTVTPVAFAASTRRTKKKEMKKGEDKKDEKKDEDKKDEKKGEGKKKDEDEEVGSLVDGKGRVSRPAFFMHGAAARSAIMPLP